MTVPTDDARGSAASGWTRRAVLMASGAASMMIAAGTGQQARAQEAARPDIRVKGPVRGGSHGWPMAGYPGDLSRLDYVEEEYFFSGTAASFRPVGELDADGRWAVEQADAKPYVTRMIVQRPRDPACFNGTAIVSWNNVSLGTEVMLVNDDAMYDGFAYVGVTAQYVGIHGFESGPAEMNCGLRAWDGERYGGLSHPGDSFSYDMFTQAGRLLKDPGEGIDPMGGLKVRKLIASGGSQSAMRLRAYANAVHPLARVYDAFVPFADFGTGSDFSDNVLDFNRPDLVARVVRTPSRIREDLDVPMLIFNTETEAPGYRGPLGFLLQPDTDRLRLWEVAGASHATDPFMRQLGVVLRRDGFKGPLDRFPIGNQPYLQPASHVAFDPTLVAAYFHVHAWINGGAAPPVQPRLEFVEGEMPRLSRDGHGIARGGIRLPDTEVPIAMNTGSVPGELLPNLGGAHEPFSPETLKQLYPTHADYVGKVAAAARAAEQAGVILPARAAHYVEGARSAPIPPA